MKLIILSIVMLVGTTYVQADECNYSCSRQCINEARQTIREARDYLRECGEDNDHGGGGGGNVSLYHSDNCSSDLIANLRPGFDCSLIADKRVWGIRINGQCEDISDMDGSAACIAFKAAGSNRAIQLYHSDNCQDSLIATVDRRTDCSELARVISERVWGIRVDGVCSDISDTDIETACRTFGAKK